MTEAHKITINYTKIELKTENTKIKLIQTILINTIIV